MIEIVIGLMLLGIISVAIIPALWQGYLLSAEQSATATATRELNSRIEQVRMNPTCAAVTTAVATGSQTLRGIGGDLMTVTGSASSCPASDMKVTLDLIAADADGATLARASAIVYVP
ncbi:hypothetical protein Q9S36_28195 [Microbacterium sp. ARD31]|uniref:hypothetical protein n=1 Tax=Microbacterium sp. ARD31 TaxID=2962576 RepID=UPI002882D3A2|nr:hypothetical protein [Microbacterium sp. ARD31]MDT0184079.1 hypothetical protein [Microbacterium sp. ARD31]